ncbi:MAG: nucleotidyltransferase family protein [Pirellulales bacterium]
MTRDETLRILRAHWTQLQRQFGVRTLSIFGSVARDSATPTSDVDMLVEFAVPTGYFGLVRLQLHLQELLGCEVDLGTPQSLRPALRRHIESEAVRVT